MAKGNNPIPHHAMNRRRREDAATAAAADASYPAQEEPPNPTKKIAGRPEHVSELLATKKHTVKSMPRYRTMVMEIFRWWKKEYPEFYDEVVFEIPPDYDWELDVNHYYTATHDARWHLVEARFVQYFLSSEKKWRNAEKTIQYGFDHPRRYHDACLKCASITEKEFGLHPKYRTEMKAFLDNLKREKVVAKSKKQLVESDADPIGINLMELLCQWCVWWGGTVAIFCWAFLLTQWNVMGRTVNVDPLGFHNMKKSQHDSVVFEYDSNKCDQTGENVSPKHCYANPNRPFINLFLALGCYLSIFQNKFKRESDKLFHANGKDGSASNSFAKGLMKLCECAKKVAAIREHCREGHFHPHGVRKGAGASLIHLLVYFCIIISPLLAATHVTTSTMEPPPIPSVLMRGEWSLGKVLDVYWRYSMIGDTYLGRCLAGLDPDSADFSILPPHFTCGMENKFVHEGMRICFGGILDHFGGDGVEGPLLLFLASIVYHSEWLLTHIADNNRHCFLNIPILSDPRVLRELRKLVTLEPAGDVKQATGVPRHVKLMEEVRGLCSELRGCVAEIRELRRELPAVVKEAIDDKAAEAGQVTAPFVLKVVKEHFSGLDDRFDALAEKLSRVQPNAESAGGENRMQKKTVTELELELYPKFRYKDPGAKGRNKNREEWDVPHNFQLPTMDLFVAWRLWLRGFPLHRLKRKNGKEYSAPVKPLRLLHGGHLPHEFKHRFDNMWCPVLEMMEDQVKYVRGKPASYFSDEIIRSSYEFAVQKLCG